MRFGFVYHIEFFESLGFAMEFWTFLEIKKIDLFWIFQIFFFNILDIFGFLNFFSSYFFFFYGFFSKLLRLIQKVTKATTRHQKWTKMGPNSKIMAKKASDKGRNPSQELEVGPSSGPYLLV